MREQGFYWVKLSGVWIIAEYYEYWYLTGLLEGLPDEHFDEIEETRIIK